MKSHFEKEKFDLMGKYLGEDVLKEGLLTGGPTDKAQVTQAGWLFSRKGFKVTAF